MILHIFYAGLCPTHREELDNISEGYFTDYNIENAWRLLELHHIEKETYYANKMEVENSIHHKCIKDFPYGEKMGELLGIYELDPDTITDIARKCTEFLQVP
jgi:hypothetical protein